MRVSHQMLDDPESRLRMIDAAEQRVRNENDLQVMIDRHAQYYRRKRAP